MLDKIKNWWEGDIYYLEDVLPGIRYRRHWTANTARVFYEFYLNHWKWLWSTVIAIISTIFTYLQFIQ